MTHSFATEIKAYTQTDSFKQLSQLEEFTDIEAMPGATIMEFLTMFSDAMSTFEKKTLKKWDADSLTKVLTHWLPKHADLPNLEVPLFLVTLNSFIAFLDEKKIIPGPPLLMAVAKSSPLMLARSEDENFWSPKKRTEFAEFLAYMDEEIDALFGDEFGLLDELMEGNKSPNPHHKRNNVVPLTNTPKKNSLCFCGSGKKYEDCHGDDILL
ncbi:SEC-C domain-containing protein [uncultured Vagococcus sp.]|uniref:SEC-C domain-containing protein n=1 Tax=uncultured Vagococcus sp. TaxID=189676 RepID=UPI0028D1D11E|nr:SEC-C domain-containing protein [uncultured Vagococcus sp.]